MKHEPARAKKKKSNFSWIIDESKYLSMEEVGRLRNVCMREKEQGLKQARFTQVRNWFMIELGLNAGLRVEEMTSLKCKDFLVNNNRSSIVVTGKGGKKRAVWISTEFKKTYKKYLGYKERFGFSASPESYVLNNLKGRRISKRALQKFFKKLIRKADLSGHYYIHCLRHTYTTFLLKAGNYNYRFVQEQLGHASIKTTQVYAGIIESEGRKAVEKLYK